MLDVTEQKKNQKVLKRFFDLSKDLFCIVDCKSHVCIYINPAFEKVIGYSQNEIINSKISSFIHREDQQALENKFRELKDGLSVKTFEVRCKCKDGSSKWVEWNAILAPEEGLIYGVGRDVTESKNIKEEMARLERVNVVDRMAAAVTHEIRNPLAAVRGFLQLLEAKGREAQEQHYYKEMIKELDRANSLLTQFLALTKSEPIKMCKQNLNTIIENLYPLIQAEAKVSGKKISLKLEKVPDLHLNEDQIRQMILNLVKNGLEAMQQNGEYLAVKTFTEGEKVILAVKDEGNGIDPRILEKLGTPFLTTKKDGTGLGLSVCYSIAKRHKADIKVETGAGGTTFFVRFSL